LHPADDRSELGRVTRQQVEELRGDGHKSLDGDYGGDRRRGGVTARQDRPTGRKDATSPDAACRETASSVVTKGWRREAEPAKMKTYSSG
jgi:hypothetical protein